MHLYGTDPKQGLDACVPGVGTRGVTGDAPAQMTVVWRERGEAAEVAEVAGNLGFFQAFGRRKGRVLKWQIFSER
jgi:hypothetical protein